jgi:Lrp/AsnC family leucine-responsive transcriptional regulator
MQRVLRLVFAQRLVEALLFENSKKPWDKWDTWDNTLSILISITSLSHTCPSMGHFGTRHMIDDIDRKILKEMQEDARTSYAELGRRVGLTTPAVIERVRKLEDAHIITGYRAEIDTARVGLPIMAFIRMSISGVDYSHIIEVAQGSNEVLECHRGTGGDSFIMKIAVSSVEHLQEMIDRLTPYGITTTTIVLSSPVKRRVIEV